MLCVFKVLENIEIFTENRVFHPKITQKSYPGIIPGYPAGCTHIPSRDISRDIPGGISRDDPGIPSLGVIQTDRQTDKLTDKE